MSTRIRFKAFEKIRETNSGFFHALLEVTKAERGGEVVMVQDQNLRGAAFVEAWDKFVKSHPEAVVATEQPQDELWQAEQEQANLDALKARIKQGSDAAVKQFNVWVAQSGLENSTANQALVIAWIKANTECPSAGAVDAAIRVLGPGGTQQLAWKKAAAEPVAPTPPPPPPPPVLIDDPDAPGGKSEQLPINAEPRQRYTKAQLRDLDKRQREATNAAGRAANNEVALKWKQDHERSSI